MLKVWNVSLVIVTFFLTIFGTFMTRSGVVQSVHAFGEDRELAWMFTVFMVATLTASFGLVIYRLPLLRARNELDSWVSREAAFLANNWVLLFSAFFVLFVTMFPTLSEALKGERLTVAAPFYNKWMAPVGLVLLFLTGVGPLLAWRKSSLANLRDQFLWPTLGAVVTASVTRAFGIPIWAAGLCFALCAFVTVTILQEFIRGARVRRDATGTDLFTALIGLFARSRRRYGGYIIHLGIVLVFLGFAGNAFQRELEISLHPNQQAEVGAYTIHYQRLSITDDGQKQMVTAEMNVTRAANPLPGMYPARWFFRNHESEPTTEVALRRTAAEDLYIALIGYDVGTQSAQFRLIVNPLVNWIWFGVGVMLIGTFIALLPERAFAFATNKIPAGAATTSLLVLALVAGSAATARAQHAEAAETVVAPPQSPLEKDLRSAIICMCGDCGRKRVGECLCPVAAKERDEIAALVKQGKTRDEVIQYFVKQYGSQEPLAEPIDRGFNRLAWLFPYAAGVVGVVVVGGVALRWSRRTRQPDAPAPLQPVASTALQQQLDDELRDLD